MGLSELYARLHRYTRAESDIPGGAGQGAMTIKEILETYKDISVVGLSSQTWRPSYSVSRYMQTVGYRIIPVNPNETEVLGEKAYATLDDVPEPVGIVD